MSERPIIKIPKTPFEKTLDVISFVLVGFMFILSIYAWSDLPDKIPVHFNFWGEADRWGGKASILIWPIIGLFLVKITFFISKAPHMHNYPVKVTKENATRLYAESKRLLVFINFLIASMLTLSHLDIVLKAYEKAGLGGWVMPTFLSLIFATMGVSIYRMVKFK